MAQRYAACIWVEGSSKPSQIHPDDLQSFIDKGPYYGRVLRIVSSGFRYVRVAFGEDQYRVKRACLLDIDLDDCIEPGAQVVIAKSGEIGTIRDIIWHHKDAVPNYFLFIGTKKKSKRYLPGELTPVEGT